MKIIKTSSITIYMVNNKITCARNNKTGRFVKLAIAAKELAKIQAKKIEKCSDVSSFSAVVALLMLFLFFFFAMMFKRDGYMFAEYAAIFCISLVAILAIVAIITVIYSVIYEIITNNRLKGYA